MKKTIWIFLVLAVVAGFFIGVNLYNVEENESELENDINEIKYNNILNNINTTEIETSVHEEKISINTEIIEEIYYVSCDHLVKTKIKDIKEFINMTKEDINEEYPKWEIKEFNMKRVVLYKEESNFCNEHFLVKDVDGFVTIYSMDNSDNMLEIVETTEIETKYLTETDKEDLKEGIKVYTKQKLNKLIEDFE